MKGFDVSEIGHKAFVAAQPVEVPQENPGKPSESPGVPQPASEPDIPPPVDNPSQPPRPVELPGGSPPEIPKNL